MSYFPSTNKNSWWLQVFWELGWGFCFGGWLVFPTCLFPPTQILKHRIFSSFPSVLEVQNSTLEEKTKAKTYSRSPSNKTLSAVENMSTAVFGLAAPIFILNSHWYQHLNRCTLWNQTWIFNKQELQKCTLKKGTQRGGTFIFKNRRLLNLNTRDTSILNTLEFALMVAFFNDKSLIFPNF